MTTIVMTPFTLEVVTGEGLVIGTEDCIEVNSIENFEEFIVIKVYGTGLGLEKHPMLVLKLYATDLYENIRISFNENGAIITYGKSITSINDSLKYFYLEELASIIEVVPCKSLFLVINEIGAKILDTSGVVYGSIDTDIVDDYRIVDGVLVLVTSQGEATFLLPAH